MITILQLQLQLQIPFINSDTAIIHKPKIFHRMRINFHTIHKKITPSAARAKGVINFSFLLTF